MNRAELERRIKAGLRDAVARTRRGAEQVADMREATAGRTHPDAIRVQKLLALADRAPTYAERKECLRSAWDYTKDYVSSRGPTKGGIGGAKKKKENAAKWHITIQAEVLRLLNTKTNSDIAGRTYLRTGKKRETVEKYVAEVREAQLKK